MPSKNLPGQNNSGSEDNPLLYCQDDGIGWVTFNRPQVLNALDESLTAALVERIQAIEFDTSVRCVVLSGNGPGFMSGGDIGFFGKTLKMTPQATRAAFHTFIHTAGFGMSLMMACDFVMASQNSFFTMAYAHMALSPDGGSSFSLPRIVGTRKAMEMALLGDKLTSAQALEYGLVNWVVEDEALTAETLKLAQRLAAGPTHAYGQTKQLINNSFENTLAQQLVAEEEAFASCTATQDFPQAAVAFLEKKKPTFQGC